jgi:threonine 3-dehydrogenase
MFAITKAKPGKGLTVVDVPAPKDPQSGWVQIKVSHAGVCGTDMHIYQWDEWSKDRVQTPVTLGHEFVGEIVKLGDDVTDYKIGERVSAECHIVCGECPLCEMGKHHVCPNTEVIGVDRDGAFAEFVNVPASNLWRIPEDVPSHHAAIFDPLGNAMHAIDVANIPGRSVTIVGAGAIGLMAVAMCKFYGARHISVIEPQPHKRDLARELGADIAVIPEDHANERIIKALGGHRPRIVLEMSGNESAINNALDLIQHGGTFVQVGIPSKPVALDLGEQIVFKGLSYKGVVGRELFRTWQEVTDFALSCPDDIEKIISHTLPAADFEKAFEMLEKGEANKVVLEM